MFKKFLANASVVALIAAGLGVAAVHSATASTAVAAPGDSAVRITVMGINAPGADTRGNRNSEYVWIKNTGANPVNVLGWKLADGYGNRFAFRPNKLKDLVHTPAVSANPDATPPVLAAPEALMLPAGHSIVVYTGEGRDTTVNSTHSVYLNLAGHYLNNSSGETVRIKDRAGVVVDQISYDAYGINPTP